MIAPSVCLPAPIINTKWLVKSVDKRVMVIVSTCLEYYQGIMSSPGFRFVLVTEEVTEEVEEYLYDELSLIAEFGGALGLFLGVSFLTLWDFGQPAVELGRQFWNPIGSRVFTL